MKLYIKDLKIVILERELDGGKMNIYIISLKSATKRRKFQESQFKNINLDYIFLDAVSIEDISDELYNKHHNDWQRPMKTTEVACYFSHRNAWQKVIDSNEPALILEDDALLSVNIPRILNSVKPLEEIDIINLEIRSRKKYISKTSKNLDDRFKLYRLFLDKTGAAGYILWPSGAQKLLEHERKNGIAIADAHIKDCYDLVAYQVEPALIVQLDQCEKYGIENHYEEESKSTVSTRNNYKGGVSFRIKRLVFQVQLAFRQLSIYFKSNRRYIDLDQYGF